MIKTTPINSVRVLKVGVTLHFHFSDSIVYKGECWCIRGRHYEYGQPVETANEFLQNVTRGCLNRWTEHKNEKYGIQVDKNKVNPSTEVRMEYQCVEEMTTEERKVYEEYEYIFGPVTKKWVEEQLLHPQVTK